MSNEVKGQGLLTRRCRLGGNDLEFHAVLSANNGQLYRVSDWPLREKTVNVVYTGCLMAVYGYDDIAFPNTAARSRALRRNRHYLDAELSAQLIKAYQAPWKRALLGGYPQMSASDSPQSQQLRHHPLCSVGRDGKAYPLGRDNDGGIDSDDSSPGIDERPS